MLKRYQETVGKGLMVGDAILVGIAWVLSYWLRFYVPLIEVTKGFPLFEKYAALSPLLMVLWILVFSWMGIYRSGRMIRRTHEVFGLLRAHLVTMLVFLALTYLFSEYRYSRVVIVYFGAISGLFLVSFHLAVRNFLRQLRKGGRGQRLLLAVGDGATLEYFIERMQKFPELGIKVIKKISLDDFDPTTLDHMGQVDEILISASGSTSSRIDEILSQLRERTIDVRVVPDLARFITLGCAVESFDGFPVINLNESPMEGWGEFAKRVTDVLMSGFAILLLSPLFLLLAVLIKLTSRGPVFYRQTRMGLDGKTFEMIKFRTMIVDAEKSSGAVWARPKDDRRTALGSFLRATSLDEFPQLWNVLKGEMTLVGPRPERPVFVQKFRQEIPNYMLRHKVKSGMTGWAQVNGWRGDTSLDKRIECDLYYIKNWSYSLDLKILFLTLWRGFINRNAY